MSQVATASLTRPPAAKNEVLAQLSSACEHRGLEGLAGRLVELSELCHRDMESFESALAELPRGLSLVHRSADHLLALGGKRLRPMCVALASRLGSGFGPAARDLAVAVELLHSATLLHDDVVDLGERRRGAATARAVYGNAASIFAGDWLLIEAIRRVRAAHVEGVLTRLLDVIETMIFAEAVQLENRGRINTDRAAYFQVIEGKTAALFRWAMFAGARSGGLDDRACEAVTRYGLHLGVAFQAIDDLLDLTGDERATGKALFTDLREGKMTFPLIVALEREPSLLAVLEEVLATPIDQPTPRELATRVLELLRATRGQEACLELAKTRADLAIAALEELPPSLARAALVTVAETTIHRDR
jgi:octaprenyl-diphosphate synthase